MTYKTVVISSGDKTKKTASAIEETANKLAQEGWEFITFSLAASRKAILVFRVPEGALPPENTEKTGRKNGEAVNEKE